MRTTLSLLIGLTAACAAEPYETGGGYRTDPCSTRARRYMAQAGDDKVGGTVRDISVLDQYAYRLRLSDFCGHTILLVLDAMDDPTGSAWLDDLPALADARPSGARPLTVLTAWVRDPGGEIPDVADLRNQAIRLASAHPTAMTCDQDLYVPDTTGPICEPQSSSGGSFPRILPVLRDPPRLEVFAPVPASTAVQWIASDVPAPDDLRLQREISSRFRFLDLPGFVVLEPEPVEVDGVVVDVPIIQVRTTDPEDPDLAAVLQGG